jgi:hypothetical protein
MRTGSAARLLKRSRPGSDGSRGAAARRAWRRLVRAGDGGDPNVIDVVWSDWLASADRELPVELTRWPIPEERTGVVGVVAVSPALSAGDRELLATIVAGIPEAVRSALTTCRYDPTCVLPTGLGRWAPVPEEAVEDVVAIALDLRRGADDRTAAAGLVPAAVLATWKRDRLAMFYALTGQTAQLLALDRIVPLLARLYREADEQTRAGLRSVIGGLAGPDLVRVVAGRGGRDRPPGVTAPERDYLVRELDARQDWAGLWELVGRLPLVAAAAVAGEFAGRWRLPDPHAGRLLDLLAGADPDRLAAAQEALAQPRPIRLEAGATPQSCSFSVDGRSVAIAVLSSGEEVNFGHTPDGTYRAAGKDVTVDWLRYDLPGGELAERRSRVGVLYDGRLADRWENRGHLPVAVVDGQLVGLRGPLSRPTYPDDAQQAILAYPGGFVRDSAILPSRDARPPYQGGRPIDGRLAFHDATGQLRHSVQFHATLGLPDQWHYGLRAVDLSSGRILLDTGERVWLLDDQARTVLASAPPDTYVDAAAFLDQDRLAMVSSAPGGHSGPYLRIWRVRGDTIDIETEGPAPFSCFSLVVFPDWAEVVTIDYQGRLRWLDARTLAEIRVPATRAVGVGWQTPTAKAAGLIWRTPLAKAGGLLWDSPDGRSFACHPPGSTGVDVFLDVPPAHLAELTVRPLAEATEADLATAAATLAADPTPPWLPAARPFLDLFHQALPLRPQPDPNGF